MTEAWIAKEIAPYFSLLSLTAAIASLDVFVRRGEHRTLVTWCYGATVVIGVALLAAGLIALAGGQPWYVPFALGFPGALIAVAAGWSLLRLGADYAASENRRTLARDI